MRRVVRRVVRRGESIVDCRCGGGGGGGLHSIFGAETKEEEVWLRVALRGLEYTE